MGYESLRGEDMNKSYVIVDTPYTCAECYFRRDIQELSVGNGLYKKISRCLFAPEDVEDPWRDLSWQVENKEDWCPMIPIPEVDDMILPFQRVYMGKFVIGKDIDL